jgi:gliding motility-associated-like protein
MVLLTLWKVVLFAQLNIYQHNNYQVCDCLNPNCGEISVEVFGGNPPYSYKWSNGNTTDSLKKVYPGTYFITVTDSSIPALIGIDTLYVQGIEKPKGTLTISNVISCAKPEATVAYTIDKNKLNPNFGYNLYSFSWQAVGKKTFLPQEGWSIFDKGVNQRKFPTAGTYRLLVGRNGTNDCIDTVNFEIKANNDLPKVKIIPDTATLVCSDFLAAPLDASASAQGKNYTYEWYYNDLYQPFIAATPTLPKIRAALVRPHILKVTDLATGCSNYDIAYIIDDKDNVVLDEVKHADKIEFINCRDTSLQLKASVRLPLDKSQLCYEWSSVVIIGSVVDWSGNYIVAGRNTPLVTVNNGPHFVVEVKNKKNGCIASRGIDVFKIEAPPIVKAGRDTFMNCKTKDLVLNGSLNYSNPSSPWGVNTPTWQTLQGKIDTGLYALTPLVSKAGIYILKGTSSYTGCSNYDTVVVRSTDSYAEIALNKDSTQLNCAISTLRLNASKSITTTGFQYEWTTQDGHFVQIPPIKNLTPKVNGSGTYHLIVRDSIGCIDTASVTIKTDTLAPVAITQQINYDCSSQNIVLSGKGSSEGARIDYLWKATQGTIITPPTLLEATVKQGLYSLLVRNHENGCSDSSSIATKSPPPIIVYASAKPVRCYGEANGQIRIDSLSTQAKMPFLYRLNDVEQGSSLFSNLNKGIYYLTVEDANGCMVTDTLTITQPDGLGVSLGGDQTLGVNEPTTLLATPNRPFETTDQLSWQKDNQTIDCTNTDCTELAISPSRGAYYAVKITDKNGCTAQDAIFVSVRRLVYIPTAFSPNADMQNDCFSIETGKGVKSIAQFSVFDRWGNLVFQQKNTPPNTLGWDGLFKGASANEGVYTYFATIAFEDDSQEKYSGEVLLLR